jgi:pyruvate formate lyase activating enzyme
MDENLTGKLYDIQGFSVHDGPGIRTTVYLKECPLRCLWCHSPESMSRDDELAYFDMKCIGTKLCGRCIDACPVHAISACEPETITRVKIDREKCTACLECTRTCPPKALAPSGYEMNVDEVYERVCRDRPFFGEDGGATISGGEPMAQFDFTLALARRFKENGVSVCLDTTGFAPGERYLKILPYIDLFLYDLKHMDSGRSRKLTGVPNEVILENARLIAANGGKFQIRIPVIPKLNDSEENLRKAAEFAVGLGDAVVDMQLLPYHKLGSAKYTRIGRNYALTNVEPPTDETMHRHLDMMLSYGLPAHIH